MITINRPDLTVDQLADDFWLAVEGIDTCTRSGHECDGGHVPRPPDDVLALLEPCGWCTPHRPNSTVIDACPDCIDGRPKFQIVVPCPVCVEWDRFAYKRGFDLPGTRGRMRAQLLHEGLIEQHGCDAGRNNTRTVSRTFTVTGDEPLLPATHDTESIGSAYWGPACIEFNPTNGYACWWPKWDGALEHADGRDITLVGATERTTHALHVRVVP